MFSLGFWIALRIALWIYGLIYGLVFRLFYGFSDVLQSRTDRAEQDYGWVAKVKDRALQTAIRFWIFYGLLCGFSGPFMDTRKMLNKGFVCSQGTTTYPGGDVCGGAEWHTPQ